MTRTEHIAWMKDRAKKEYEFYLGEGVGHNEATRNAVTSAMSDIGKHPETNSDALRAMCMMMLMNGSLRTKSDVWHFIDGFN